jgi:hypothetical protein
VLFSNSQVAASINQWFEPVWESVRHVPIVRVDFGRGAVVTRTLHGNIATWVCSADGQVLDVLPGIYTPEAYADRLSQLRLLANYVDQEGPANRQTRLQAYHQGQAEALRKRQAAPRFVNTAGVSKAAIERAIVATLVPGGHDRDFEHLGQVSMPSAIRRRLVFDSSAEQELWSRLSEDTALNETHRRSQIHEMMATAGCVHPPQLTRWLYREVLHSDLDDPYLGLGGLLFRYYPFASEEQRH